jgi:PKD repeat protein
VNPAHTYTAAGTFNVVLVVTDTSGLSGTSTSKVTIVAPPVANAGGPYTGIEGVALNFSASGSTDPQGESLTYTWDFGDGNTGSGVAPTHAYAAFGTYSVKLTATNTSGLSNTATVQVIVPNGRAYASQKALSGAHIYLFAANIAGYGGMGLAASSTNASVSLLSATSTGESDSVGAYVNTGADGSFFIAGDYSCTPGSEVYLYALGGSTGLGMNTGTGLMAALGACPSAGNFAATPYVVVNEVSTIATAYAFAGFATDATHVSSSGTALAKVGIANAFANAGNLETLGTGAALAITPGGNGTVPQAEINTLANILASCTGTGAAGSNGCTLLFGDALSGVSKGTMPTDTATAAINIAHNPGSSLASLYALASGPPFTPQLTAAPNDFSIALSFTGGGLDGPGGLAADGSGNVWIANELKGSVSELSALGVAISGSGGYTGGGLDDPDCIAIDAFGNVWAGNYFGGGVTELSSSGAAISPATGFTAGGYDQPESLAIDSAGNVWANSGNAVTKWSSSGTVLSPSQGYVETGYHGGGTAIDAGGNVWLGEGLSGTVIELSNTGSPISPSGGFTGGGLNQSGDIAIDASGHVWVTNFAGPISELSSSGKPMAGSPFSGGGAGNATGIAIDGSGNVWTGNGNNTYPDGISELSNSGAPLSPSTGFMDNAYLAGGFGALYDPGRPAVDGSGNVWLSNGAQGANNVIEFVGIATPVTTPLAVGVKNNMLGMRP